MAFPATTEPASLIVFGIPELMHSICPMTERRDNVSLMRVCRQLFYCMIPFVWEEVNEANVLVSLIPGAGIVPCDSEVLPYMVMQLPESLELSRFKLYAPHVKRFTPSVFGSYKYYGWERFLASTRSVDLLPNLETLSLPAPDDMAHTSHSTEIGVEWMNWIAAFLSKSVRTLVLSPSETVSLSWHSRWLDIGLTNDFLGFVSQKCPGLSQLKLSHRVIKPNGPRSPRPSRPPRPPRVYHFDGHDSSSYNSPETHLSLRGFNHLSSLLISSAVLRPEGLAILSSLPRLESLSLFGYADDHKEYCRNLSLPVDAFPALTNLKLRALTCGTIVNLCKAKAFVSKLQSITLSSVHTGMTTTAGLPNIFEMLLANNSTITTLDLRGFTPGPVAYYGVLESWGRLPIVTLHLGGFAVKCDVFDSLYTILSCLPRLEDLELNMRSGFVEPSQLRMIIEVLPRLRHVLAPVKWGFIVDLKAAAFGSCQLESDTALHLKSIFTLPDNGPPQAYAKQMARYLSSCRPLAPIVCESYLGPYSYIYTYKCKVDEELSNLINHELSALRLNNADMF